MGVYPATPLTYQHSQLDQGTYYYSRKAIAAGLTFQDWKGNQHADYLAKPALKHRGRDPFIQQMHSNQLSVTKTTRSHMLHTWHWIFNSEAYFVHLAAQQNARQVSGNSDTLWPRKKNPNLIVREVRKGTAHNMVISPP